MNNNILADAENHPDLYFWNGALDEEFIRAWMEERRLKLPEDLVEFWKQTGGGSYLESENLLGPLGNPEMEADLETTNEWLRESGLPEDYLVFNMGSFIGAVRLEDNVYVLLDNISFEELGEYDSLDEWYLFTVRNEFRDQYDL